mmetsp:Transcript_14489/g.41150  ORF Transcript_14489/g.41150 Transcript_14489/m.41150 type:complete len:282 (+) Transcript_14489:99-944(+)
MDVDTYHNRAKELALQAGAIVEKAYHDRSMNVEFKGAVDLVTSVDKEVEALLITSLRESFPECEFLAEESADVGYTLTDKPTWVIDPVDGTTNFVHKFPFVCVSIALCVELEVVCGVVYNPILKEMFEARRGKGALLNGKPIKVAPCESLQQAVVATNVGYDRTEEGIQFMNENMAAILRQNVRSMRSLGSSACELCSVACGRLDGFYEYGIHPWDIAAAALILEEAGGQARDPSGDPLDLLSRRVLGGSPGVVTALASILASDHFRHPRPSLDKKAGPPA